MPCGPCLYSGNPLREVYSIQANVGNRVTAGSMSRAQIGSPHDAGNSFKVHHAISVSVSNENSLGVAAFGPVDELIPVVDSRIERIVRHEEERLIPSRMVSQHRINPAKILRREMSVPHFHDRTLVQANETKTAVFKYELITSPELREFCAAGL